MKGLLVKDAMVVFAQRKKFIILFIGISLMLSFKMDATFIVSYLCLIGMILGLNAYNYDENNNGMPFIMTLPSTRKAYALEKHLFSMMTVTVFWLLGLIMQFFANMIQKVDMDFATQFPTYLKFWVLFLAFTSIVTFVEIRFGTERSRIVILLAGGLCFVIAAYGRQLLMNLGVDVSGITDLIASVPPTVLTAAEILLIAAAICVSAFLSMRTLEKRDF
ncbi:MAG: ABC-2 transporter permease [Lachnospiraceae bacterium]|nr:ABC-2 transporter permease [Lachnospiraceae bacterium]